MPFTRQVLLSAAIILVDIVFFAMEVAGIKATLSDVAKKGIAETITVSIESCLQTQTAIINFVSNWELAEGVVQEQAWAIWNLLKGMRRAILWTIVKACIQGMSYGDWVKTLVVFSATIVASFVSDGLALAIKFALSLNSAVGLVNDITAFGKLVRG